MQNPRDTVRKLGGRQRLLETARRLFTSRGASNVGINDVTDSAGVAKMTLYNNFPSKEALTLAVYEEMVEAALGRLRGMNRTGKSEVERIADLFEHFAGRSRESGYRGCPFIHASLQAAEPAGPMHALVQSYKRALRQHVFELLDARRSNRDDLADQIVILLDGAVTELYIKGVADPIRAASRAAKTLLSVKG
jgi:AcrR family transcriptional regulator